jgi:hypothetical protein
MSSPLPVPETQKAAVDPGAKLESDSGFAECCWKEVSPSLGFPQLTPLSCDSAGGATLYLPQCIISDPRRVISISVRPE